MRQAAARYSAVILRAEKIFLVDSAVNMYTNPMHDKGLVTEKNLLGKCVYNSALWGKVYNFFSRYGILIVAALIFMSVIVFNMIKGGRKASRN